MQYVENIQGRIKARRFLAGAQGIPLGDVIFEFEQFNQFLVFFWLFLLEVAHQTAALTDLLEQALARGEILFVLLQVFSELEDFTSEHSDLHLWRPCIVVVGRKFVDNCCLLLL